MKRIEQDINDMKAKNDQIENKCSKLDTGNLKQIGYVERKTAFKIFTMFFQ